MVAEGDIKRLQACSSSTVRLGQRAPWPHHDSVALLQCNCACAEEQRSGAHLGKAHEHSVARDAHVVKLEEAVVHAVEAAATMGYGSGEQGGLSIQLEAGRPV